jgi:hypothetical protein
MQSADDEKAQIGAITPSLSRMHQLSASAIGAGMAKSAASALTHSGCLMFAPTRRHAAAA